ncbi:hypothetical protein ACFQO7_30250 [Catellatospora aurea]|uniref:Matrixin n=1 Tax=Catellatospora aurea TaxID=1337874 RepID=A0ABW2H3K3_9ACTN
MRFPSVRPRRSGTRRALGHAVTAFVTALVAAIAWQAPAGATLSGNGMAHADFQIKPYSYNSQWQGPMDKAISNWNVTATPVWITKSSSAPSWVTAASYSNTWYGLYSTHWNFGRYFDIKLNSRTIAADASNFSNFVTAVFVHELGHGLNLADNPSTSQASRMKYGLWDSQTTPQQYDINDVNSYYP